MADKFKFWVGADIVKAKNEETGKVEMMLKGIASTNDEDSDGEFLDSAGFDLSYFKDSGYVNWHHGAKQSPKMIIGEPTEAKITKAGMYVECKLYDKPLSREVFDLAETLKKSSTTRSLGFSIEGKALERDPLNPKRITKAKITGLAVTHMPKNNHTLAEIMKGEADDSEWIFDEDEIRGEIDGLLLKSKDETIKKDEDEEEEETVDVEKTLDTSSAAAIIPESVEGKPKELTKGDVYKNIFDNYSDINITKARELYNFIEKTRIIMAKEKITDEVLEKAYDILGLIKGEGVGKDNDNADGSDANNDEDDKEIDDSDKLNKGGEDTYTKKMYKGKMEYYEKGSDKYLKKGDKYTKTDEDGMAKAYKTMYPPEKVEKSETLELLKSLTDDLNVGNEERMGNLEKAIMESSSEQTELFKAMGTVLKGLKETMEDLTERIDQVEKEPATPKSIRKGMNGDRFHKANQDNKPSNVFSISQDKRKVLNILEAKTFLKDNRIDEEFAKAMTLFETSNMVMPATVAKLAAEGIRLTK